MSIRETFSNSIDLAVINESHKGAVMQISALCLGTLIILFVETSSVTGIFRHLSDYVSGVRNFKNTKSMSVTFFFKTFKISARFENAARN